jgi:hypothetical protein
MAIEIRELIIRTNIVDDNKMAPERFAPGEISPDEKRIVDRCVEKILRKLSKRKDR